MSFCVNGSKFGPNHYYRDDEQARRVLGTCRENPVLITGLRRIAALSAGTPSPGSQVWSARAHRSLRESGRSTIGTWAAPVG